MSNGFSRRQMLRGLTAAGAAGLGFVPKFSPRRLFAADDGAPTADRLIAGKDPRLIVHKAAPCEIETPIELLAEHRITPKELLFVRNNQEYRGSLTLEPPQVGEWDVEFDGLLEYPRSIGLAELRALPQVEREMVVQCSGNGRTFFSQAVKCPGSPWHMGALANVRFGGVPFAAVLEKLELNVDPRARFVTAEGRDEPPKPDVADFEHSLPLGDVLKRSILALTLNGEPLPAVHGGPVRLVTPGYYGTMHVKWLSRCRFEASETANHHQVRRYRTPYDPIRPGDEFEYGLENSEPNWRMRIKSHVLVPADGAEVRAGKVEFRGVAFNDGACRIERVEISTDGQTWRPAETDAPESLYAWYPWRATLDLPAGEHAIRCRAVDALGRTQPLDGTIHWNPAGYCWNGVQTVRVKAT